jgi:hypothetical protein
MNGVLGAEDEYLLDDIPQTFTTELGYYTGLQPQHHNKETDVLRTNLIKTSRWLLPLLAFSLAGCG